MENYFTLLEKETIENSTIFKIELNKSHSVYKGHFPTVPVTPGVVLVDICRELTENLVGTSLHLVAARSMKFLIMVNPAITPVLNVKIDYSFDNELYEVKAIGEFEGHIYFKIQATFAK
ncbi:MAG: hypothetical protein ABI207_02175 [Crocinitomicaceae bacterium]